MKHRSLRAQAAETDVSFLDLYLDVTVAGVIDARMSD